MKKIKKQVRNNKDVITLDTSNWNTAQQDPAQMGKAIDSNPFTYIKNDTVQNLVGCRCFELNRCAQQTSNNSFYHQREGDKLYLKALNLHYTFTVGYDDQAIGLHELTTIRYCILWSPEDTRFRSTHTPGSGNFAPVILEYPGNIMSPYRQHSGFKYRILKQGLINLSWNTNAGGSSIKSGRIKLNLSKRKNKVSQYSEEQDSPVQGHLYFVVMADNAGPTPEGSIPAKVHFVSRLICNE